MYKIEEIRNKEIWENFLLGCKEKTFLQSWNWGEFNKMMGEKVYRFGIFKDKDLMATAQIIKIVAKRGTFLFIPHGPNVRFDVRCSMFEVVKLFLEELRKIAKREGVDFIRIAPVWERTSENIKIFKMLGFKTAPIHIHPELTWELDITPSEQDLLMQMRKTTRYLIRKAQKNEDIKIIESQDIKDVEKFNTLYQATKSRHHFIPFSLEYLRKEFLSFSSDNQIIIFLGKYKEEIVSSGIFIFWQQIGFYHHGASSLKYPKVPVSYLLLWEAIKKAKEKGCQKFNFWGIAPNFGTSAFKKHPWAGLTLFKMGFGGNSKEYVKTQDFVISSKYWFSFFIEKIRKMKRRL